MSKIQILENVDLKPYNSYKTGGKARYFATPYNINDLIATFDIIDSMGVSYEIIGAGSNLLISDHGYDGMIILLNQFNRYIMRLGDMIDVGAGVRLIDFIDYAIESSLSGAEKLSGIPGLIGGGIKMNAGAFDLEFKDFIRTVDVLDLQSRSMMTIDNANIGFGYRKSSNLDNKIILSAKTILKKDNKDKLIKIRSDILSKRRDKQPLNKPSCGSVFKRPIDGYAGELIEKVALKGFRYNGAIISDKHANFILNVENATSSDIKYLIDLAINTVYDKCGILLIPEVKFIGNFD